MLYLVCSGQNRRSPLALSTNHFPVYAGIICTHSNNNYIPLISFIDNYTKFITIGKKFIKIYAIAEYNGYRNNSKQKIDNAEKICGLVLTV